MRVCILIIALLVLAMPFRSATAQGTSPNEAKPQTGEETPSAAAREPQCRPAGWGTRRKAKAAFKTAILSLRSGRADEAESYFRWARTLAIKACDGRLEADSLLNEGALVLLRGQRKDAAEKLERALELYSAHGGRENYGLTLANLGVLAMQNGDIQSAERSLRQADKLFLQMDGGWQTRRELGQIRAIILVNLAKVPFIQGEFTEAESLLQEARKLDRRTDFHRGRGAIHFGLGVVAAARGRREEADRLLSKARTVYRSRNRRLDEGLVLLHMGTNAIEGDRLETAEMYVTEALNLFERLGNECMRSSALDILGTIAQKRGSFAVSEGFKQDADKTCRGRAPSQDGQSKTALKAWGMIVLYSNDF